MTEPKANKPAETDGGVSPLAIAGGIVLALLLVPIIKEIFKGKESGAPEKPALPENSGRPKDIGGYQQKGGW